MKSVLILAGAQKSGTTTLFRALVDAVPTVKEPRVKEWHYFSLGTEDIECNIEWYRDEVSRTAGDLFIDGSTSYLAIPSVAASIKQWLGGAKILVVLRDPAIRIYSAFEHSNKKFESVDQRLLVDYVAQMEELVAEHGLAEADEICLQKALDEGLVSKDYFGHTYMRERGIASFEAPLRDRYWQFKYFQVSSYSEQVREYRKVFGANAVKVVAFEDLVKNPCETLQSVVDWLGFDAKCGVGSLPKNNATLLPKSRIARMIGSARHDSRILRRIVDFGLRVNPKLVRSIRDRLLMKRPPQRDPELLERIRALLADEYAKAEELIPEVAQHWKR